ncbi:MAG: lipopolysaccharide kinase InaA family protein [Bacteroidales bacterium]|nr:lipopolysaccharide kinase InaA family protein [Bacteroidales bacterium]
MSKIVVNKAYSELRPWVETIPQTFANSGQVIYDARNQIRVATAPNGTQVNIKRYHTPAPLNRVIYSYFRPSKAERAYRNALLLQEKGVPTPVPIGYLLTTRHGLLAESYLITKQSPLTRRFYEFREHGIAGYEDIVKAFAYFSARLHQQGIYHKDYSPGNILFDKQTDGSIRFELVDINRMEFGQSVGIDKACRNFCRLWGKQDFFELLAAEYATARGWDAQQVRRLIIRYWKRFWRHRK